jgi:hypothetical protein
MLRENLLDTIAQPLYTRDNSLGFNKLCHLLLPPGTHGRHAHEASMQRPAIDASSHARSPHAIPVPPEASTSHPCLMPCEGKDAGSRNERQQDRS